MHSVDCVVTDDGILLSVGATSKNVRDDLMNSGLAVILDSSEFIPVNKIFARK